MKKAFRFLSKGIRFLLILTGILAVSAMLFFFIREIVLALFYPIDLPINAQITDFEDINLSSNSNCNGTANLEISTDYPFQMTLSDIPSLAQFYKVGSLPSQPFIFDVAFNQSSFEIRYTGYDKSPDNIASSVAETFKRLQGTASSISINLSEIEKIDMIEAICSPRVHIFNSLSKYYSAGVSSAPDAYSAVRTVQEIPANSKIVITLSGPIVLKEHPNITIKEILITLKTNTENANVFVGIEGYSLSTDLPNIIAVPNDKTGTDMISFGNSFSIDRFLVKNVEITAPVGKIQFGSYPEITLTDPFTSFSDIKLELPTPPYKYLDPRFSYVDLESHLSKGTLTINGTLPELIYRKQKYGISRWQMLPAYVQAGIFGLFLGAIPAGWTLLKKRFPKKKVDKAVVLEYQPAPGDFVCILVSGYLISGKLSKPPSFFSPYYVLREAHRKHKNDLTWEPETIEEIRVKASYVEQYYFKGK